MTNDKKKDIAGDILPMQGEEQKSDLATVVEQMQTEFHNHLLLTAMRAKMNWVFYNELLKAGFSAEQALELTKAKGL